VDDLFYFIEKALAKRPDVEAERIQNTYQIKLRPLTRDDYFSVRLEEFETDGEEEGAGGGLDPDLWPEPRHVWDHTDILDVALHALASSPLCPHIDDLTTDGDNTDCEAIFRYDDEWYVLKVRG
jgi:hypothetical protein